MEAVAQRELADAQLRGDHHLARPDHASVDLDHDQQRQVVEAGRNGGHPDHVEVADLQELGDEKGGGAENGRRDDGAEAAGCKEAARGVLLEAGPLHQRIGDGADRHRGVVHAQLVIEVGPGGDGGRTGHGAEQLLAGLVRLLDDRVDVAVVVLERVVALRDLAAVYAHRDKDDDDHGGDAEDDAPDEEGLLLIGRPARAGP